MNTELSDINLKMAKLQDRFKRIKIVNDQITNWGKRVYNKVGMLTEDQMFQEEPIYLVKMFESIHTIVDKELTQLKTRQQEDGYDENGVEYGEVFTDFATEDFINKNIRVRPFSGVTHADETRDGRQSNISRGMGGAGDSGIDDVDKNFNMGADSDLELARNKVKIAKQKAEEEERKRVAAEAKAKIK